MAANKKVLVWVAIGSALLIGGGIFWWMNNRDKNKGQGKDEKDVNLNEPVVPPSEQPRPTPAPPQQTQTLAPTPFKNKAEGNAFRGWMAKNHNDFRYLGEPLDTSGSYDNTTIRKAWQLYGGEYLKATTPVVAPPPPSKVISKGDMVYLSGDAMMLYSYPESKSDYYVGRIKKDYVLDSPIGRFVSDATNGFAKIETVTYQPYDKSTATFGSYIAKIKTVYVKKQNLAKTPY